MSSSGGDATSLGSRRKLMDDLFNSPVYVLRVLLQTWDTARSLMCTTKSSSAQLASGIIIRSPASIHQSLRGPRVCYALAHETKFESNEKVPMNSPFLHMPSISDSEGGSGGQFTRYVTSEVLIVSTKKDATRR